MKTSGFCLIYLKKNCATAAFSQWWRFVKISQFITLVAVAVLHKPYERNIAITPAVQTKTEETKTPETVSGVAANTTSVDSIIASFEADADSDAVSADTEAADSAALEEELQIYNDIKTAPYDNNV